MHERDFLALLKQQLRNSAGWEGDEHSVARVDALNYYLQRPRGDEVTGRSTVVSGDVSASVEANLASMLDAFSSDNIAEFDPVGELDEEQCALESDVVTHYVMKAQNGFVELAGAIKNSLLLRNGNMKVYVDRFEETVSKTFGNVEPEIHELVAARQGADVVSYNPEKRELRTRYKLTHKRFRARSVAPENLFLPKNWDSFDLQECPAVFELHFDTRSELVRMGFPKSEVARLTPCSVGVKNHTGSARNPGSTIQSNTNTPDPSQDIIEWFEGYVLADVDGDGIAERRRVAFVWDDATLLEDEPEELVPYATGVTLLMPNRVTGISDYDKLRQNQDEHTGLKRALYDNINTVTKNRLVYLDGKVDVDDVGDGRPNGALRAHDVDNVQQAVMALAVPDNSGNVLANIEALKRERSEMGGAALDLASGNAQIGGERMGSQGLDRAYSVMEQLAALKTKTFAATLIRSVWLLAHATLRRNFSEPVSIRRNGKWQTPVPSEWQPRDRVTVRVGMSPGERARQAASYEKMLNWQVQLADKGMDEVLVNSARFYRTLMRWCNIVDVRNPEQFWIDPQSEAAQQALKQRGAAQQADTQARKSLMDRAIGTQEATVALDKYKHDSSLQHDYWKDILQSEVEEAKIVGDATTKLLQARETARVTPIKRLGAPAKEASK